jgi:putative phage-type endonuclease
MEQGSEAWHDVKCARISGTTFQNVMSAKGTASYKDLITNIAGEYLSGIKEDTYTNVIMERGIELEPFAANLYEEITGRNIQEVGFCTSEFDNDIDEWVGVSPDRLVDENGILEIKCPIMKTHLNYIRANVMPNNYKWQVQGQLFITGAEYCDFMSYYPNLKPFIITVAPDIEMHKQLEERLLQAIKDIKEAVEEYNIYDYFNERR